MSTDISIVIPFHNEQNNLAELLPRLEAVTSSLPESFEVLLVDDRSMDNSHDVACSFASAHPEFRVLQLEERGGQTGCYALAFEEARGEHIIRMDSDLQDSPEDLPLFMERIREGADLVMGLRECRRHRRMLRAASALYDLLILLLFDTPLHSNSGSFVAFQAGFVKRIPWRKNDHRYLPLIAMHRGAENVREVIVRHHQRTSGVSKYNPYRKILFGVFEALGFLLRLRRGKYDIKQ